MSLLAAFLPIVEDWRNVFPQQRTFQRGVRQALGSLVCLGRRRGLSPTRTAPEQSGTNHDGLPSLTMRASKVIWPPKTHQVGPAALLGRKSHLKLLDGSRVILHSPNLQVGVGW